MDSTKCLLSCVWVSRVFVSPCMYFDTPNLSGVVGMAWKKKLGLKKMHKNEKNEKKGKKKNNAW